MPEYNAYLLRLAVEEDEIPAMSPGAFTQAEAEYQSLISKLEAGTDVAHDRMRYYELEMLLAI